MRQFTTPTMALFVKNVDLRGYQVTVTYRQKGNVLNVENPDVEYIGGGTTHPGSLINVELTQAQTGSFVPGTAECQINWVDLSGHRDATKVKKLAISENLITEVI